MRLGRIVNKNNIFRQIRMISSNPEATVLLKHNGAVANVTLNRPKALNALEPSMVNIMNDMLHSWNNDDNWLSCLCNL